MSKRQNKPSRRPVPASRPEPVLPRLFEELRRLDVEMSLHREYRQVAKDLDLDDQVMSELARRRGAR